MAKPLVTDELWEVIEPLLPEQLAFSHPRGESQDIEGFQAISSNGH